MLVRRETKIQCKKTSKTYGAGSQLLSCACNPPATLLPLCPAMLCPETLMKAQQQRLPERKHAQQPAT